MRTRVLIVDDHTGFRGVVRLLLEGAGFDVVGEAGDGPEAVARTDELSPALVLLDVHLPGADGFAVARELAARPGAPAVLLISSRPISDLWRRVAESPAAGFLTKEELSGDAIRELVGG